MSLTGGMSISLLGTLSCVTWLRPNNRHVSDTYDVDQNRFDVLILAYIRNTLKSVLCKNTVDTDRNTHRRRRQIQVCRRAVSRTAPPLPPKKNHPSVVIFNACKRKVRSGNRDASGVHARKSTDLVTTHWLRVTLPVLLLVLSWYTLWIMYLLWYDYAIPALDLVNAHSKYLALIAQGLRQTHTVQLTIHWKTINLTSVSEKTQIEPEH